MKFKLWLVLLVCMLQTFTFAQTISYYKNIYPIIAKHCSVCHKNGENTPFVLDSYESVSSRIQTILKVVNDNIMPPFPADTSYVKYHNQNVLTRNEKKNIQNWITNGMKKGKTPKPNQTKNKINSIPKYNLELKLIPYNYISANNDDIYVYRILNWDFGKETSVVDYSFDIRSPYLHHAEILSLSNDDTTILNDTLLFTNLYESKSFKLDKYLFGWFPGSTCGIFPVGTQMKLEAHKNYLLILHYIPTAQNFVDSSKFLMVLNKDSKPTRQIQEFAVHGTYQYLHDNNHGVFIPANTIQSFHYSKTVTSDMSVFAVYGHAHHLCKNMLAYAVTPQNDTIPLLKINDWKFNWQLTYRFDKYKKIPKDSEIHFFATYDNTANNSENMHQPPIDVYASFMADDEMMEFFMLYLDYQKGDELKKIQYMDNQ
ncbi:MAG: hypothetical protein U0T07_03370 [Chitinophagales bacterium]